MLIDYAAEPIKSLTAMLYVTAARVGEIVQVFTPEHAVRSDGNVALKIRTEKNRSQPFRMLLIPEVDPFLQVCLPRIMASAPGEPVWNFSRQYAHREIRKLGVYIGRRDMHPHLLRHSRLTHLVLYGDFNEFELARWAGWSSPEPARHYVRLHARDCVPKLLRLYARLSGQ